MSERFPIMAQRIGQKLGYVPMEFMRQFESRVIRNHGGQTLARLKARGGLSAFEALNAVKNIGNYEHGFLDESVAWPQLQQRVLDQYPNWQFSATPAPASEPAKENQHG